MSEDVQKNEATDWETESSGGFIKFEEVGDGFTGLVTAYEKRRTPKGDANSYTVFTKSGKQSFYAPKDLHDKLSGAAVKYGLGNYIVKVSLLEKKRLANGNDFKVFEVLSRRKTDDVVKELGLSTDEGAW